MSDDGFDDVGVQNHTRLFCSFSISCMTSRTVRIVVSSTPSSSKIMFFKCSRIAQRTLLKVLWLLQEFSIDSVGERV